MSAIAALAALAVVACGEEFDPASLVTDLRVMAIRATPPHIAFAETAVIDALTYAPGPEIAFTWSVCLVGLDTAAGFQCADPAFECPLGTNATAELSPVALLQGCLAGVEIPEDFAKLAGIDGDTPSDIASFFEEPRTVTIKLTASAGDRKEDAIKRVLVGGAPPFNANPLLAATELNGAPWAAGQAPEVESQGKMAIKLDVTPSSRETYEVDEHLATEEMVYAFFADDGKMGGDFADDERRTQEWKAPEVQAGAPPIDVRFWFVARDGRGGVDWVERTARVHSRSENTP